MNFNSSMVRLKDDMRLEHPYIVFAHFNSSMVRLKGKKMRKVVVWYRIFQFQYNTPANSDHWVNLIK